MRSNVGKCSVALAATGMALCIGCQRLEVRTEYASRRATNPKVQTLAVDLGQGVTMEFLRIVLPAVTAGTQTRAFFIGRTEVTNAQFRRFRSAHDSTPPDRKHTIAYQEYIRSLGHEFNDDEQPAVYVRWEDANAFAIWLGEQAGNTARLPTEAEWESACRAGSMTRFSWGDSLHHASRFANTNDPLTAKLFKFGEPFPVDDGYRVAAPVGSFRPNAFGLFDMHGNVAEWTSDIWREPVLGPLTDDGSVPGNPRQRVVKGGDFTCGPSGEGYFGCTCDSRSWNYLGNANLGTGFRVVLEIDRAGSARCPESASTNRRPCHGGRSLSSNCAKW